MLAYDDRAMRDKVWKTFGADREWQKLRLTPASTDPEIVSNIIKISTVVRHSLPSYVTAVGETHLFRKTVQVAEVGASRWTGLRCSSYHSLYWTPSAAGEFKR